MAALIASSVGISAPGLSFAAVTPSDSVDLAVTARGLFIGTGGTTLTVIGAADSAGVLFKNVASGTVLPICVKRVMSTGTNCADIVALS